MRPRPKELSYIDEYREYAAGLIESWDRKYKSEKSNYYSPANARMNIGYRYAMAWINRGASPNISDMYLAFKGKIKFKQIREGVCPFNLALRVMFDETELRANLRSKYAHALRYAYLHNVKPKMLSGFIHQAGSLDLVGRKLKAQDYEKWFKKDYDPERLNSYITLQPKELDKLRDQLTKKRSQRRKKPHSRSKLGRKRLHRIRSKVT